MNTSVYVFSNSCMQKLFTEISHHIFECGHKSNYLYYILSNDVLFLD